MLKNNYFDKSTIVKIKVDDEREIESVFNKLIFYFRNNKKVEILGYDFNKDISLYDTISSVSIGKPEKYIKIYNNYREKPLILTPYQEIYIIDENGIIKNIHSEDVKIGDTFIKRQDNNKAKHNFLNTKNLDILCGFLLGDGSLSKNKQEINCSRICKNHGLAQRDYMLFCMSLFKNAREANVKSGFTGEPICGFTSKSYHIPSNIYKGFYKGKNKQISYDIERFITNRSLAIWYMDDGNLGASDRITLHTEGFNKTTINNLINILDYKFGIKSKIQTYKKKHGDSKETYYHKIVIDKENSLIFFNLIQGLVHPNLKYKIPEHLWVAFRENEYHKYENFYSVYTGLIVDKTEQFVDKTNVSYNIETVNLSSIFCDDYLVKINN